MARITFYFDGFNFYNGLKESSRKDNSWKPFYWIDPVKLCEEFIGVNTLVKVKYFTADPLNVQQRVRHKLYFSVIKKLNPEILQIINGKYKEKTNSCYHCGRTYKSSEEKRIDVSISVTMLSDCINDITDTLILVSADTDLIPAIETIRNDFPNKKIRLYFPPSRNSAELFQLMKPEVVFLEKNKPKFQKALMPNEIEIGGNIFLKPKEWA